MTATPNAPSTRRLRVSPNETEFVVADALRGRVLASHGDAAEALQAALAAAGGAEVIVEVGDYPLTRPVQLPHRATLRGRGRATRLFLQHTGAALRGEGVDGVSVRDLQIVGDSGATAGIGVHLSSCGDAHLIDLHLLALPEFGVRLDENSFLCEIRSCQFDGCGKFAVSLHKLEKGRIGDYLPNHLDQLAIHGGGGGILCEAAVVVNIRGCSVFQTQGDAFVLKQFSNSVLITGCRTFQITGRAIYANDSHELNLSSNIFCWHTEEGMWIEKCRWGVISANEVIDNGSFNPGTPDQSTRFDALPEPPTPKSGIVLRDVKGFCVTANTIFNWPQGTRMACGIDEDSTSQENVLSANNVNYFGEEAVRSAGQATQVAHTIASKPEPHVSTADYPLIQSFEHHRVRAYIQAKR